MDFSTFTDKQAADYAFGANVFPQEFIQLFEVSSKSISDPAAAAAWITEKKSLGFATKKKTYSEFTAVIAAKKRQ